jgi:ribonuclease HII
VRTKPTLRQEARLSARGCRLIAGLDEAGRGSWAGPVVAAAVVLPVQELLAKRSGSLAKLLAGVRDSKQLTPKQREEIEPRIRAAALAVGVGSVPPKEIDRLGIVAATRQAMALALADLSLIPDFLLIDALFLPDVHIPQKSIVKGDTLSLSIAAASIVGKVWRDRLMIALDAEYPGYGFARHKGYGTPQHRVALAQHGPSPIHRFSFAPLHALAEGAIR